MKVQSHKQIPYWQRRRTHLSLFAVFVITFAYFGINQLVTEVKVTPSGLKSSTSFYLTMRDGVRIAVDLWLPPDLNTNEQIPTLIRATRYGRSHNTSTLYRLLAAAGFYREDVNLSKDIRVFNSNGYAVLKIDARGSGASFGSRQIEWSSEEIDDYSEVIDWIIAQPWSNQKVGAYGVSYEGNSAELIASIGHPAVKAVAPLYSYFDPYKDLIRPGGQFNQGFVKRWSNIVHNFDYGTACKKSALACWWYRQLSDGVKPVDDDSGGVLRNQAMAQRNNPKVFDSVHPAQFRNNEYGSSGVTIDDRSPYRHASDIEASNATMLVWVGWYDSATVDGALSRFATLSNPQQLIISPFTHGGRHDTNPFAAIDKPVSITKEAFYTKLSAFFDPLLKQNQLADNFESKIHYYTFGENTWKTTGQWPPAGISNKTFYFKPEGKLSRQTPIQSKGGDSYTVDYTASTGQHSRWHTISGSDVFYTDRYQQGKKLLTYTSEPLAHDLEITGNAELELFLVSSEADCAVHAYLEAVSPDNEVTYLTEGILHCKHRKISSEQPAYKQFGPYKTHLQNDAVSMPPGEVEAIKMSLFAVSARVPEGHKIRIAIAGNDAAVFEKPDVKLPHEIKIKRNQQYPSRLVLPAMYKLNDSVLTSTAVPPG